MNIEKPQVEAIKALAYTDAESHFLSLVASHSGYLVARRFRAFAGTHWGKSKAQFWNQLQANQRVWLDYRASLTSNRASRQVRMTPFSEVNASPKMLFTVSFTSPFTPRQNLDHSSERAYLRFQCGSCTWPKHRAGLERPHFVAAESAAVAPAQPMFVTRRRVAEPCTDVPSRV